MMIEAMIISRQGNMPKEPAVIPDSFSIQQIPKG
jgi:hypothetical protein